MRLSRHVVAVVSLVTVAVLAGAGFAFAGTPPVDPPALEPPAAPAPLFADAGCVETASPLTLGEIALDTTLPDLFTEPAASPFAPASGLGCNVGDPCTSPQQCFCRGFICACINNRCKCAF